MVSCPGGLEKDPFRSDEEVGKELVFGKAKSMKLIL
jgi:hypothetical protein